MADPPILALRDGTVSFGQKPVFRDVSIFLNRGDRACLIGRNGSGKSTLMKTLIGEIELDAGERYVEPGARIVYLRQEPQFDPDTACRDIVLSGLPPRLPTENESDRTHMAEAALDEIELAPALKAGELSGGQARRLALARAFAGEPDVLLLDEPTNHLDLRMIRWLEDRLKRFRGALLMVSHDRAFLRALGTSILWLERGKLRQTARNFSAFDEWSEEVLEAEEKELARLDTRIAQEIHWLHRGVTARRRRNMGRLARLAEMRDRRAARTDPARRAKLQITADDDPSKLVLEAHRASFTYPDQDRPTIQPFSTRILKGDRVGLVGPNGAGKTTLLRMLIGELPPTGGKIRFGAALKTAYFDQNRAQLDPAATLWTTLCEDGGDTVFVNGRVRHVVAYLKDFLFSPDQARQPVGSLSGGERNRLMLARILTKPSNLLVLDEPTNDLDMDTLDLLQETLDDYDGTLLIVSHDRDFLDRLVTSVIVLDGSGQADEFVGGYSEYARRIGDVFGSGGGRANKSAREGRTNEAGKTKSARPTRLSYKDQRDLDLLPDRIAQLEAQKARLEKKLADPALYQNDPHDFERLAAELEARQAELAAAEQRWLDLETLRETIEAGKPG